MLLLTRLMTEVTNRLSIMQQLLFVGAVLLLLVALANLPHDYLSKRRNPGESFEPSDLIRLTILGFDVWATAVLLVSVYAYFGFDLTHITVKPTNDAVVLYDASSKDTYNIKNIGTTGAQTLHKVDVSTKPKPVTIEQTKGDKHMTAYVSSKDVVYTNKKNKTNTTPVITKVTYQPATVVETFDVLLTPLTLKSNTFNQNKLHVEITYKPAKDAPASNPFSD